MRSTTSTGQRQPGIVVIRREWGCHPTPCLSHDPSDLLSLKQTCESIATEWDEELIGSGSSIVKEAVNKRLDDGDAEYSGFRPGGG